MLTNIKHKGKSTVCHVCYFLCVITRIHRRKHSPVLFSVPLPHNFPCEGHVMAQIICDGYNYLFGRKFKNDLIQKSYFPLFNYWKICICMPRVCAIIGFHTVSQSAGFVQPSCPLRSLQRYFIAPESLFLTSVFEAEYKRMLREITDALLLKGNVSSGDKSRISLNCACLRCECGRTSCVLSWTAQKIEKIIQEGKCFSCLCSAAFQVWLWVRLESLHFLQNHSSDNHLLHWEGRILMI